MTGRARVLLVCGLLGLAVLGRVEAASAQGEQRAPSEPGEAIERAELAPAMADDEPAPALDVWRGLDLANIGKLLGPLDIPPRSPALNALWVRLITSAATPPVPGTSGDAFTALRAEALFRSGLIGKANAVLDHDGQMPADALGIALAARGQVALGHRERGCAALDTLRTRQGDLPQLIRRDVLLVQGYCAAASGDKAGAGLAATLAREEGLTDAPGLIVLDAIAADTTPSFPVLETLSVIDYRLLELAGAADQIDWAKQGAPLLAAAVLDPGTNTGTKLLAGEAAARANAIPPKQLADIYREAARGPPDSKGETPASSPALTRARLLGTVEGAAAPGERLEAAQGLLTAARTVGLDLAAARVLAESLDGLQPSRGPSPLAQTAIEIFLAAGRYEDARLWAGLTPRREERRIDRGLEHWLALVDIADPGWPYTRGAGLPVVEALAREGKFTPDGLHRLATVLDALGYSVPVPLWEAASRTPQPEGGNLPETGVLTGLGDAARKKEFGRTVLLALAALGPDTADRVHIIALGDTIRALRAAGLDADARQLGFEALYPVWPRLAARPR